jgi:hypothetical protein
MKKTIVVAVLSVMALAGCQAMKFKHGVPDPLMPRVFVQNDAVIVVDQEPIYVVQRDQNTIVWRLDPNGAYMFSRDEKQHPGIEFVAQGDRPKLNAACARVADDPRAYSCTYARAPKGKYFYKITATRDDARFVTSDPTLMND